MPHEDLKKELTWDGRVRSYELHIPSHYLPEKKYPLVIVLHGARANAAYARRMSDMCDQAEQKDFFVVYPNGTGTFKHAVLTWNAKKCCGYAVEHNIDDVGFLTQMISEIEKEYSIHPSKIFVTGISNGAMMAYRLACESSKKIAAVAAVSGPIHDFNVILKHPISILAFHGTNDQFAPYEGGQGTKTEFKREDFSVRNTIDFWVKHNECNPKPEIEEFKDILKETYTGGKSATQVILYTVKNGGHAWPGGKKGIQYGNMDDPTESISATQIMCDFFSCTLDPSPRTRYIIYSGFKVWFERQKGENDET